MFYLREDFFLPQSVQRPSWRLSSWPQPFLKEKINRYVKSSFTNDIQREQPYCTHRHISRLVRPTWPCKRCLPCPPFFYFLIRETFVGVSKAAPVVRCCSSGPLFLHNLIATKNHPRVLKYRLTGLRLVRQTHERLMIH